jgi:hypothetical protein
MFIAFVVRENACKSPRKTGKYSGILTTNTADNKLSLKNDSSEEK